MTLLIKTLLYCQSGVKQFIHNHRQSLWIGVLSIFCLPCFAKTMPIQTINHLTHYFTFSQQDFTYQQKQYRLFIAAPKLKYNHRLLLLLDGNAHFPIALSKIDTSKSLPLIVGIGYITDREYAVAERTRDYTFPAKGDEFAEGGQAGEFLQFIATQVMPFIEQHYQITQKLFFGHSFGGLFGLYTLFNKPQLFDDYVLASPSLWWGNGTILQYWSETADKPHSITLTISEYEQNPTADPNIDPARLARIQQRRQHLKIETLYHQFLSKHWPTQFTVIPKTNHGSSIPFALEIAVKKVQ